MTKKKSLKVKQDGFTLIEVLVVVAITGMVAMVLFGTVIQIMTESDRSTDITTASQQVQNAGYWFKHDGVMAQTVVTDDPATTGVSEFLTLEWTDSDGIPCRSAYTLESSETPFKKLIRSYTAGTSATKTMFVADSIVESSSNVVWSGSVMAVSIVSQVGNQNAARTYKVSPRAIE